MIDAHCHVHWNRDLGRVVAEAQEVGVQRVICNATEEADWSFVQSLRETYGDFVVASIGIHPWFCENLAEGWGDRLKSRLVDDPTLLIGEIGIDHYSSKCALCRRPPKQLQAAVLASQLSLAVEINRQFSVHCVRAHKQFLKIMQANAPSPPKFLMHSWSGSPKDLHSLLQAFPQSAYISLSQHSLTDASVIPGIRELPIDKILIETDSPCLCLPPFLNGYAVTPATDDKGEAVNEPKYLQYSFKKLSEIRGQAEEELRQRVLENTRRFLE